MMFLLRTAFWLSVVIFLIPVDHAAEQQARTAEVQPIGALEAASAAQATLSDMSGFCGRNPTACEIGGRVATTFMLKAQTGARMVYDFIDRSLDDKAGAANVDHGTLTATDLAPAWRGPGKAPQGI
ncbi:conserved exported hypothetical protein [uncultured Pleomorphomonas sp.]|uniref:DUF5330 domain-containing protein n=2 Tax=Pleomorphomonas TaxID=261933 RepID=A0A2G9WUU0_9HYPH|nr:DUF5330 domain-containing protein [Pleomorphomonas carboxyditropha]PIO98476.1 hypothetical protein CJ014_14195 [Pleomorphomonas carboxyditropha]SCM75580.1 conserved exported hypothetical protein [uncultured Pleomorphomonas sp.]